MDRCEPPRKGPGDTFPWDHLEDVAVSVLWVPRSQKLLWQRQIDELGMSPTFKVYTDSESAEVATAPPPAAKRTVTEQERKETQATLGALLWGAARFATLLVCIVFMTPIVALGFRHWRRRRAGSRRAAIQRGQHAG